MIDRIVVARRLEHGGKDRRFRQGHVARRLAEEFLRRLFDAGGAGAEIDAVEIELDDLVLGEILLEPHCQHGFLGLARHGALGLEEQVLGELLGQRRAALDDAARPDIFDRGAHEADRIDAEMRPEPAVLDGDDRLRHIGRQFVDAHFIAEEGAALGENVAIGGEQHDARLAGRNLEQALLVEREPDIAEAARRPGSTPHSAKVNMSENRPRKSERRRLRRPEPRASRGDPNRRGSTRSRCRRLFLPRISEQSHPAPHRR